MSGFEAFQASQRVNQGIRAQVLYAEQQNLQSVGTQKANKTNITDDSLNAEIKLCSCHLNSCKPL